jgi:hypothetical protein
MTRILSWIVDGRLPPRPTESIERAVQSIEHGIDVLSGQGNGMDAGPYYLGSDQVRGLQADSVGPLILAAKRTQTPFVFSVGGAGGADLHLNHDLGVLGEIARRAGVRLRIAVISGEISKGYLKRRIKSGVPIIRVTDTPRLPKLLTEEEVDRAVRIQAQMGPEPIIAALQESNIDGVITGRAVDIAVLSSYALFRGIPKSVALHAAKVIECGAMAGDPSTPLEAAVAQLSADSFTVSCPSPDVKLTTRSIAAHALYEREDPFHERNPGGILDVAKAMYEQLDERTVRCWGATWTEMPYTIKVEGVAHIGYQSTVTFGIRDPHVIANIDALIESVTAAIRSLQPDESLTISTHIYGRNGVLGSSEPSSERAHELAVLYMVTARTQELAEQLARYARSRFIFTHFPGRRTTSGNIALPLQPATSTVGPVYSFNVWHLLPLDNPCEPFPYRVLELG